MTPSVGGLCGISTFIAEPVMIKHVSPFEFLIFGEFSGEATPRVQAIERVFKGAHIDVTLTPEIAAKLWWKFIMLTAMAGVSSATRQMIGPMRSDPDTRAYASEELLLVTRGAADWRAGLPVALYRLDRATGTILTDRPAMTVIPANPRLYYRGRSNYVDGRATILGMEQELVFGLSHVAPPAGGLEAMLDFNRWACGIAARK